MAIEIKVSEKIQKPFEFELKGKDLVGYIDNVTTVSGFVSSSQDNRRHLMVSYKKRLYIVGYSPDTFIALDTGQRTNASGGFSFEAEKLKGIVKNRGDLAFAFDGKELAISGGSFKSQIKTTGLTVDQIPQINTFFGTPMDSQEALSGELLEKLKIGVAQTKLLDPFNNNAESPVTVVFDKNTKGRSELRVMTQTNWAGSMYKASIRERNKPFKMVISSQVFGLISKLIGNDTAANFYFQSEGFKVETDNMVVGLPPLQEAEADDIDRFNQLLSDISKAGSVGDYTIPVEEISKVMQSILVLSVENDAHMNLEFERKQVTIGIDNDEGSASDVVALQRTGKKLKFSCYPKVVNDLLNNVRKGNADISAYSTSGGPPNIVSFISSPGKRQELRQFCGLVET